MIPWWICDTGTGAQWGGQNNGNVWPRMAVSPEQQHHLPGPRDTWHVSSSADPITYYQPRGSIGGINRNTAVSTGPAWPQPPWCWASDSGGRQPGYVAQILFRSFICMFCWCEDCGSSLGSRLAASCDHSGLGRICLGPLATDQTEERSWAAEPMYLDKLGCWRRGDQWHHSQQSAVSPPRLLQPLNNIILGRK